VWGLKWEAGWVDALASHSRVRSHAPATTLTVPWATHGAGHRVSRRWYRRGRMARNKHSKCGPQRHRPRLVVSHSNSYLITAIPPSSYPIPPSSYPTPPCTQLYCRSSSNQHTYKSFPCHRPIAEECVAWCVLTALSSAYTPTSGGRAGVGQDRGRGGGEE